MASYRPRRTQSLRSRGFVGQQSWPGGPGGAEALEASYGVEPRRRATWPAFQGWSSQLFKAGAGQLFKVGAGQRFKAGAAGRRAARGGGAGRRPLGADGAFEPWLAALLIDRMRHWSIFGSVGPLHGPGRQRSHASAGQPDSPEGEDQLGPTTSDLGPYRRRTFRRTLRTNQMRSTNSLHLRRRYHRLPGIHRRRHSDRRAATLRGSGPVSGPVAGRA